MSLQSKNRTVNLFTYKKRTKGRLFFFKITNRGMIVRFATLKQFPFFISDYYSLKYGERAESSRDIFRIRFHK